MSRSGDRVVLDTNLLVSAVLFAESVPARALFAALDRCVVLVSEEAIFELAEVLGRPKFDRYLSAKERSRFLAALLRQSELVEVEAAVRACRDPRDDKFLSLALAGSATTIVSGDEDLLILDPFQGIRILRPAGFLVGMEPA